MAKTVKCRRGEKRFTVVRVEGDMSDTHAGRSFEDAMKRAQPDPGDLVEVFRVCADDAGMARLMPKGRWSRSRSFWYKKRRK